MKTAREEILEKLKNSSYSIPEDPDFETRIFYPVENTLENEFKNKLELLGGTVYLPVSENELIENLNNLLVSYKNEEICCRETEICELLEKHNIAYSSLSDLPESLKVGITGCEFLIAHTGSVMVSSVQKGGRQLFVYPPVHIVIARKQQLVDYLAKAYELIFEKYKEKIPSQIALITGASRTADIEKTLVMGAHGPKDLHVFVI